MTLLYSEIVNKVLFDQRGSVWVKREIVRLRSRILKLRRTVEETPARIDHLVYSC